MKTRQARKVMNRVGKLAWPAEVLPYTATQIRAANRRLSRLATTKAMWRMLTLLHAKGKR